MQISKKILLLFIGLTSFFLFKSTVQASSEFVRLPQNQIIDSDYIQAAQSIQVDGLIKGDAFLAGGLVTVNGTIDGDLFVLGGKVVVNGVVNNNIRVLGGDVTINAPVGRNVLLICGNCTVTPQSTIVGSVLASGGNFDLSAAFVGRGLRFLGNRLYLNSPIGSEVFVVSDREFLLGPTASIAGSLKYTGSTQVVMESGATVGGQIAYQKSAKDDSFPRFFGAREFLTLYRKIKPFTDTFSFAITALIGFVFLGLFPKGFEKVARAIEYRPYASLGWGLLAMMLTPLLVVLFALTVIGIPVSFVLVFLAYLAWVAALYLTAFFLGRKILLKRFGERRGWSLLLGLFIIYLLGLIPFAGPVIKLFLVTFSLGGHHPGV
jgi:cytoskeletal protein CcmA (bactofilin family)